MDSIIDLYTIFFLGFIWFASTLSSKGGEKRRAKKRKEGTRGHGDKVSELRTQQ